MTQRDSLVQVELARAATLQKALEISELQRESVEIDVKMKRIAYAREMASNFNHHFYPFTDPVTAQTVGACIETLNCWSRLSPKCAIEIGFYSPGGMVFPGVALFDHICALRSKGHYITTNVLGYAASMAGILLQAGDLRVMGRESYVLIHEISTQAAGKIGEIEDAAVFLEKFQSRAVDIFIARAGGNISRATFIKKQKRKDWWLSSQDCLKYGFVDEVR